MHTKPEKEDCEIEEKEEEEEEEEEEKESSSIIVNKSKEEKEQQEEEEEEEEEEKVEDYLKQTEWGFLPGIDIFIKNSVRCVFLTFYEIIRGSVIEQIMDVVHHSSSSSSYRFDTITTNTLTEENFSLNQFAPYHVTKKQFRKWISFLIALTSRYAKFKDGLYYMDGSHLSCGLSEVKNTNNNNQIIVPRNHLINLYIELMEPPPDLSIDPLNVLPTNNNNKYGSFILEKGFVNDILKTIEHLCRLRPFLLKNTIWVDEALLLSIDPNERILHLTEGATRLDSDLIIVPASSAIVTCMHLFVEHFDFEIKGFEIKTDKSWCLPEEFVNSFSERVRTMLTLKQPDIQVIFDHLLLPPAPAPAPPSPSPPSPSSSRPPLLSLLPIEAEFLNHLQCEDAQNQIYNIPVGHIIMSFLHENLEKFDFKIRELFNFKIFHIPLHWLRAGTGFEDFVNKNPYLRIRQILKNLLGEKVYHSYESIMHKHQYNKVLCGWGEKPEICKKLNNIDFDSGLHIISSTAVIHDIIMNAINFVQLNNYAGIKKKFAKVVVTLKKPQIEFYFIHKNSTLGLCIKDLESIIPNFGDSLNEEYEVYLLSTDQLSTLLKMTNISFSSLGFEIPGIDNSSEFVNENVKGSNSCGDDDDEEEEEANKMEKESKSKSIIRTTTIIKTMHHHHCKFCKVEIFEQSKFLVNSWNFLRYICNKKGYGDEEGQFKMRILYSALIHYPISYITLLFMKNNDKIFNLFHKAFINDDDESLLNHLQNHSPARLHDLEFTTNPIYPQKDPIKCDDPACFFCNSKLCHCLNLSIMWMIIAVQFKSLKPVDNMQLVRIYDTLIRIPISTIQMKRFAVDGICKCDGAVDTVEYPKLDYEQLRDFIYSHFILCPKSKVCPEAEVTTNTTTTISYSYSSSSSSSVKMDKEEKEELKSYCQQQEDEVVVSEQLKPECKICVMEANGEISEGLFHKMLKFSKIQHNQEKIDNDGDNNNNKFFSLYGMYLLQLFKHLQFNERLSSSNLVESALADKKQFEIHFKEHCKKERGRSKPEEEEDDNSSSPYSNKEYAKTKGEDERKEYCWACHPFGYENYNVDAYPSEWSTIANVAQEFEKQPDKHCIVLELYHTLIRDRVNAACDLKSATNCCCQSGRLPLWNSAGLIKHVTEHMDFPSFSVHKRKQPQISKWRNELHLALLSTDNGKIQASSEESMIYMKEKLDVVMDSQLQALSDLKKLANEASQSRNNALHEFADCSTVFFGATVEMRACLQRLRGKLEFKDPFVNDCVCCDYILNNEISPDFVDDLSKFSNMTIRGRYLFESCGFYAVKIAPFLRIGQDWQWNLLSFAEQDWIMLRHHFEIHARPTQSGLPDCTTSSSNCINDICYK